jgi:DNA-binding GntR family transcriptional regulator
MYTFYVVVSRTRSTDRSAAHRGQVNKEVGVVATAESPGPAEPSGVERCLVLIREMVLSGELLPGQKVHQGELAEQLNVSRIPVREALATLQAEGVLVHKPNTGFTVARFSSEDFSEIYLMRRLLETELIRSTDLSSVDLERMAALNQQMRAAAAAESRDAYQRLNRAFHFALFDRSPLELVREETSRLWYMSGFYRALHLYQAETFAHLQEEHGRIITAVRSGRVEQVIEICDEHRSGTERLVVQRLGRKRAR